MIDFLLNVFLGLSLYILFSVMIVLLCFFVVLVIVVVLVLLIILLFVSMYFVLRMILLICDMYVMRLLFMILMMGILVVESLFLKDFRGFFGLFLCGGLIVIMIVNLCFIVVLRMKCLIVGFG